MSSQTIVAGSTFKSIYGHLNLPVVTQLPTWTIALTSTIFSLFIGSYLYSQFSYYRLSRKCKSRIPRITSVETVVRFLVIKFNFQLYTYIVFKY